MNRITHISSTGMTGPLSSYAHCGLSRRVLTTLGCGIAVSLSGAAAPAQGGYPALDRFGRLLDLHHLYTSGVFAGQTAQRFEYAYDLAGNRVQARLTQRPTWAGDGGHVGDPNFADPNWPGGWRPHANDRSYEFGYDALQRLIFAGHGQLDASGQLVTTGSPWRTLDWSLDLLGNWSDPNAPAGQRQGLTVTTGDGSGPASESWVQHVAAQDNRLESIVTSAGGGLATQQHFVTDAAGNLTYDGQYFYQYDGLNRLVQVNLATTWGANGECGTGVAAELCDPNLFAAAFTSDPADIARFQHRPGAWIARYAYDGLGRLICKTTPVTPGAADPGQRREHYYYDGVRRIRELIEREPDVVVLLTGGDPNHAGDPNLWGDPNVGGWAGSGTPPDPNDLPPGDPNDPEYAAAAVAAAGVEEPAEIVPLDPLPALVISAYPANWSHRDYVWGPDYVDELVAVFDRAGKCWYALSDGNFNVVAVARGNQVDSSRPLGQVVEQRVFEPYGALLTHDILSPDAPVVPVGHQGLFFDRFDGVQTDRAIAPTARGVYQNRNRVYRPREGRFNQKDPAGLGGPVIQSEAYAGALAAQEIGAVTPTDLFPGGLNVYCWGGGSPISGRDPLGLFSYGDLLGGSSLGNDLNLDTAGYALDFMDAFQGLASIIEERNQGIEDFVDATAEGYQDALLPELERMNRETHASLSRGAFKAGLAMAAAARAFAEQLDDGPKVYTVYIGYAVETNKPAYVGSTNNFLRRKGEWRGVYDLKAYQSGLTKMQARAVEQLVKEQNPGFRNVRNVIAKTRDFYNDAVDWARKFLRGKKQRF